MPCKERLRKRRNKLNLYRSCTAGMLSLNPDPRLSFHLKNPLEGYRRLAFMMLDSDVVAVSPASVWRVLKQAGLFSGWKAALAGRRHEIHSERDPKLVAARQQRQLRRQQAA
jgi:hypothetical protein